MSADEKKDWSNSSEAERRAAVAGAEGSDELIGWPTLEPFGAGSLPSFPVDVLPGWLRAYVDEVSSALEVPQDAVALLSLGVLAIAAGPAFEVDIGEGWREVLALWVVVPLESGERKSAILARLLEPLDAWQRDHAARLAPEVERKRRDLDVFNKRKERLAKAAADGDGEAERELHGLEQPRVPRPPRLFADDMTTEAIARALDDNGEAFALVSSEGEIVGNLLGRYARSGAGPLNVDVLLKGYAGESVSVDRINRPPLHLRRPVLSLLMITQPTMVAALSGRAELGERGFVPRVLFALPRTLLGRRRHETRAIGLDVASEYAAGLRRLLDRHPALNGDPRSVLRFEDDARRRLRAAQLEREPLLSPGERSPTVQAFLSKLPGTLARIAGLLALADQRSSVERRHVECACDLAAFLEAHFLGTLEGLALDEASRRARNLGRWASRREGLFSERDVQRARAAGLSKVEDVRDAIKDLERRGYVRKVELDERGADAPGRRPGPRYRFRPGAEC